MPFSFPDSFKSVASVAKDPTSKNKIILDGQDYFIQVFLESTSTKDGKDEFLEIPHTHINKIVLSDRLFEFALRGYMDISEPNYSTHNFVANLTNTLHGLTGADGDCIKTKDTVEYNFDASTTERVHLKFKPVGDEADNFYERGDQYLLMYSFFITKLEDLANDIIEQKTTRIHFQDVESRTLDMINMDQWVSSKSGGRNGESSIPEYPKSNTVGISSELVPFSTLPLNINSTGGVTKGAESPTKTGGELNEEQKKMIRDEEPEIDIEEKAQSDLGKWINLIKKTTLYDGSTRVVENGRAEGFVGNELVYTGKYKGTSLDINVIYPDNEGDGVSQMIMRIGDVDFSVDKIYENRIDGLLSSKYFIDSNGKEGVVFTTSPTSTGYTSFVSQDLSDDSNFQVVGVSPKSGESESQDEQENGSEEEDGNSEEGSPSKYSATRTGYGVYDVLNQSYDELEQEMGRGLRIKNRLPKIDSEYNVVIDNSSMYGRKNWVWNSSKNLYESKGFSSESFDHWDMGHPSSLVHISPSTNTAREILNKHLRYHVSITEQESVNEEQFGKFSKSHPVGGLNLDPCFLKLNKPKNESSTPYITLRSISSYCNNVIGDYGKSVIKEGYMGEFYFKENDLKTKDLLKLPPIFSVCPDNEGKTSIVSEITNFTYEKIRNTDSSKHLINHQVTYTGAKGYGVYDNFVDGSVNNVKYYMGEKYIRPFISSEVYENSDFGSKLINLGDADDLKSDGKRTKKIKNNIPTVASSVAVGRNVLIKKLITMNDTLNFVVKGRTSYDVGGFFKANQLRHDNDNSHDGVDGYYMITNLISIIDFRNKKFSSDITATKFFKSGMSERTKNTEVDKVEVVDNVTPKTIGESTPTETNTQTNDSETPS